MNARKIILFVLLFFQGFCFFGQSEFNSPFVSERFQMYNGLVHYKIWGITEFLSFNKEKFNINNQELNLLSNNKISQFPANYLFQEQAHWTVKLFQAVSINSEYNQNILSVKQGEREVSVIDVLLQSIDDEPARLFLDPNFKERIFPTDIDFDEVLKINELLIQEDYAFNRITGKLDRYITAVGFAVNLDGKRKSVFWVAYPKFKSWINKANLNTQLISKLEEKNYQSVNYKRVNGDLAGLINWNNHPFVDLDALLEINALEDYLKQFPAIYKKDGKIKIGDKSTGKLTGVVKNGVLSGELIWYFPNSKQQRLVVNYKDGVLNESFISYYDNGVVKEKGVFVDGLKDGNWITYFPNEVKSTEKHYVAGVMDGLQKEFHQNGSPYLIYNFENFKLNGSFEMFYNNGVSAQKGSVTNGIVDGMWTYNIMINPTISSIINRNPDFWNSNFMLESSWKATDFQDGVLRFKAKFTLEKDERCLNNLCSTVQVFSL